MYLELRKKWCYCRKQQWTNSIKYNYYYYIVVVYSIIMGFPGGSDGKESACDARDLGSIPGLGRFPGGRNGNLLQYFRLENPHGQRSLAGYSPWGRKELDTTERLSTAQYYNFYCIVSLLVLYSIISIEVKWKLLSHVQLLVTPWIIVFQALCPRNSLGKTTGAGCSLLQAIIPTQGSNPGAALQVGII